MKKFELTIPKPCHENWEAMTPEDKGRFCGACQKTVIDFSRMSDRQVADYFKRPAESVCGRFRNEQLERVIDVPKKRLPWIRYFFTISLPALLVTSKAASQGEVKVKGRVAVCTKPLKNDTIGLPVQKAVAQKTISGKVVDENDKPVHYASVYVEATGIGTTTDTAGNFQLTCTTESNANVHISYVGYTTITMTINELAAKESIRLSLTPATMGEVVMTMGFVVRKKTAEVPVIELKNKDVPFLKFAVYPNPVLPNSTFTIDAKKLEAGGYTMQILTSSGDLVQTGDIVIDNKRKRLTYQLKSVSAGPYFIRLTNKKNNKSFTEIIIVQ